MESIFSIYHLFMVLLILILINLFIYFPVWRVYIYAMGISRYKYDNKLVRDK